MFDILNGGGHANWQGTDLLEFARRVAAHWAPVAVYSSPLSRAMHTAEPIAAALGLHVVVRPHLIDMDFGDWEGLTMAEARARWPDVLAGWLKDPASVRPPRGEPLETLRDRAFAELRSLAHSHDGATIAVVSHDAVNRVLILAPSGAASAPSSAWGRTPRPSTSSISARKARASSRRTTPAT